MRKIKQNIWGNWNGYEGRRRVQEFGANNIASAYWFLTGEVDFNAGYESEWFAKCKAVIERI